MQPNSRIIEGLQRVAQANRDVDLLNVYQGVPILYQAAVKKVGGQTAVIRVQRYEAICLTLEKKTTILCDVLDEPVSAGVLSADLPAGLVTLAQFRYAGGRLGKRMIFRAAPPDPITVTVDSGGQQLTGTLADLSLNGLGVYLPPPEAAAVLRPHAVVQLTLPLPSTTLQLSGAVRYIRNRANTCRVGLTFVQTAQVQAIAKYLHQRQEAALRDLQALYQAAIRSG